MSWSWIRIGAISAFLGVLLGAFGAHLLRGRLDPALSQTYETGVRYQLMHALAMIAVGLTRRSAGTASGNRAADRSLGAAGASFAIGTLLFSGSLYLLACTGARAWGVVTPFGGLALLAGWILLAIGAGAC